MKKIFGIAMALVTSIMMSSCFKDNQPVFDSLYLVEFQDAVVTAPALNKTFPILSVANGAGLQTRRINLVGRQRETEESIKFSVDPVETTAKEGVHYSLEGGVLVLVLEGNGNDVKPNENYKKLGFRIAL